jgi:hypothetical protein
MTIVLVIATIIGIAIYLFHRQGRQDALDAIRTGKADVLMTWAYSPEDWAWYAGDPSTRWIKRKDIPGEVFITTERIYVTNGDDEYLFEFGNEKKLTQCSFFYSFLDMRAEWLTDDTYRTGQTNYHHEDFRLYVPNDYKEKGLKLAAEFKAMADANAEFSQKYVKDNEITSLFGNDDF